MRSAIVILLACAAPAFAQSKPSVSNSDLTQICSGVLEQAPGGVSGDHTKLCNCLSTETVSRLSQTELLAYAESTMQNKAPPDAVMTKITAIATFCLRQAQ